MQSHTTLSQVCFSPVFFKHKFLFVYFFIWLTSIELVRINCRLYCGNKLTLISKRLNTTKAISH